MSVSDGATAQHSANQNQASLASFLACTMNLFLGHGVGGRGGGGGRRGEEGNGGAERKLETGQLLWSRKGALARSRFTSHD